MNNQSNVREITQKALASTVLLVAEDAKEDRIGRGSGFVVHDRQIVSNFHVVEDAAKVYAKLVGKEKRYDIKGIIAIDHENDLVLLDVSDDFEAPPLNLADSDVVQVSDTVYVIGNPQGFLEGTVSQGIISGFRDVGHVDKHIQMTDPISKGSSGGPVINSEGTVVGVSVGSIDKGQLLNFAIPSNCLKTLLAEDQSTNRLLEAVTIGKLTWKDSETYHWISRIDPNHGSFSEEIIPTRTNDIPVDAPWGIMSSYSFSLRNRCLEDIENIRCYVNFFDMMDRKIYRDDVVFPGVIPAGGAKLINFDVDIRVSKGTTHKIEVVSFNRVKNTEQDAFNSQNIEDRITWFGECHWRRSTAFGFSLQNRCSETIENVHCQITFKDENDDQIRMDRIDSGTISAGKAKLINFDIDPNIKLLTRNQDIKLFETETDQILVNEGITYENPRWSEYAFYTFSLRNKCDRDVKNICCNIFFFNKNHEPIESDVINFAGPISSKTTKQVNGIINLDVAKQTEEIHVKIIGFDIME